MPRTPIDRPSLVKQALEETHTTQETLAIACDIPLERLKAFLYGADPLGRGEWERVQRALGLTATRK